MDKQLKIPQGDEKVTVELTRKELMSLAGIRFHDNHKIEVSARKKLHEILESQESTPSQLLN
ncbi:hypothetical protein GXP70_23945 [Paenibacillus lycopersici]|uniref:Uncharacterized protein n=1 Tax=Paenibacillus lycopersici TaxID=2704462 RepID=A0A6C0G638_9BACL|nr:hypothetical protein [Paenibacillus lycopersici]QHT62730.1 hypothetical protein GXP70_23945 [Paenibacillus lycopersici]